MHFEGICGLKTKLNYPFNDRGMKIVRSPNSDLYTNDVYFHLRQLHAASRTHLLPPHTAPKDRNKDDPYGDSVN